MFDRFYKSLFLSPKLIKAQNERYLLSRGARICKWLPTTGHTNNTRDSLDVGRRAAVIYGIFNIYLGAPTQRIKQWLEDNNLLSYLSAEENALINKSENDINEQEMCEIGWYVESLCALLWAGSIFKELSPQKHVPNTMVNFVPNIQNGDAAEDFIKIIRLRSYSQLYKMLDLYHRAHWYVLDASLCGEDTRNFEYGIIQSRTRALEWIFYLVNDWDDGSFSNQLEFNDLN
jgi:hypothetical protein